MKHKIKMEKAFICMQKSINQPGSCVYAPRFTVPTLYKPRKSRYTAAITAMIGTVRVSRVSARASRVWCKAAADKNLGITRERARQRHKPSNARRLTLR